MTKAITTILKYIGLFTVFITLIVLLLLVPMFGLNLTYFTTAIPLITLAVAVIDTAFITWAIID